MLSDPQKWKNAAGTEVTGPRVSTGNGTSTYSTSDGLDDLTLSTTETSSNRRRHLCRLDTSKLSTNIYEESKKQEVSASCYLVIDRPVNGFSVAEMKKLVEGLVGLLSGTSYQVTEKLLGGES